MVDSSVRLRTHERGRHGVAASAGAVHDPLDVGGGDVLIRPEVDEFVLAKEVDDELLHLGHLHDQVEDRVHERLHAAVDGRARLEQDRRLGAALGDVLVLELLRPREAVNLVKQALALARVLRGIGRADHAQAAARDVLKAVVEAVESAAVHEEGRVRALGPFGVREVRRVDAQAEREAVGKEVVCAQRRADCLEELGEHGAVHLVRIARDLGLDPLACRRELGVLHRLGRIEARQQQLDHQHGCRHRLLCVPLDALARPQMAVLRREHLMRQVAERDQRLAAVDGDGRPAPCKRQRLVVDPLDAAQVAHDLRPLRARGRQRAPVVVLDHEADEGHRAALAVLDDVEIRAVDRDVVTREDRGAALEHGARARIFHDDHDAAHRLVALGLELDDRAVSAAHAAEELPVRGYAQGGAGEHVLGAAACEVVRDLVGRPVEAVFFRVANSVRELRRLTRIAAVKWLWIAEHEGVEHEVSIETRVNLRRAK